MAVTKAEYIEVLGRAATDLKAAYEQAMVDGQWHAASQHLLTHLVWRATGLSMRQDFIRPEVDPRIGATNVARLMLGELISATNSLERDANQSSPFRKAEILISLLSALLAQLDVLDSWTGRDPEEAPFLAVKAFQLGQAEAALSLAEDGHWEEIAKWQAVQIGRPKGYRAPWKAEIAPVLQGWIDADPQEPISNLMARAYDWLGEYKDKTPNFNRPDFESLRKSIRSMHNDGLIRHPAWMKE